MARAVVTIVVMLLSSSTLSGADFATTLEAFRSLDLAPECRSVVNGTSLELGHTKLVLGSGVIHELTAQGRRVGFVLSGGGRLQIPIQRGPLYQANLTNVRDENGEGLDDDGVAVEPFMTAVVLGRPIPVLNIFTRGAARNHLKATTEDLIQIVNAVTKANHREFFDRHVYGTEVPVLGQ